LSSSLGIVKRHGGDIFVESAEGKGARVTVILPCASQMEESEPSQETSRAVSDLTFLVVDDSEDGAHMLAEGLTRLGHKVFTAFSGEEALELFQENAMDVVICDLGMPGMNGWQVGSAVKEICVERGVPKTPFVLLTGWAEQAGGQDKAEKHGVDRVAEKPVSLEELMQVVGSLMSESVPS
jgi:CheY-like chemotaxis protein